MQQIFYFIHGKLNDTAFLKVREFGKQIQQEGCKWEDIHIVIGAGTDRFNLFRKLR